MLTVEYDPSPSGSPNSKSSGEYCLFTALLVLVRGIGGLCMVTVLALRVTVRFGS